MRRPRERIDLAIYVRAFAVFARNPTVIILPFLVAVIGVLVSLTSSAGGLAALTGGILSFIVLLLQLFALGVSVIIGDAGWRRGTANFDDAWQDARRKGGDILFAAFGFTFVFMIAQYAGTLVGGGIVSLILAVVAVFGLIYTIPAAAVGGVPGSAAIGVSIERVRGAPLTAAVLTVVSLVLVFFFGSYVGAWIDGFVADYTGGSPIVAALIDGLVRSIATGYVAIVMAKVYADVSFTMPRW